MASREMKSDRSLESRKSYSQKPGFLVSQKPGFYRKTGFVDRLCGGMRQTRDIQYS